ncbi:MAG: hypothetical protein OCC49_03400 [Fibrobacterales bacterium]
MVKFVYTLLLLLCIVIPSHGTESGSAAYRAANFYAKGNYGKSIIYFNRSIEAARKEANINVENKLLLNLAALYIQMLDKTSADSLIGLVHTSAMEDNTSYYELINFESSLLDGSCLSSPYFKLISDKKNTNDRIIARSKLKLAECILTYSPNKSSHQYISDAEELLVESGQYQFILGLMSLSKNKKRLALNHFQNALIIAQQKERYYRSGIILYHMGLTSEAENPTEAQLFFIRSFQVFDKLKLQKWKNKISPYL